VKGPDGRQDDIFDPASLLPLTGAGFRNTLPVFGLYNGTLTNVDDLIWAENLRGLVGGGSLCTDQLVMYAVRLAADIPQYLDYVPTVYMR